MRCLGQRRRCRPDRSRDADARGWSYQSGSRRCQFVSAPLDCWRAATAIGLLITLALIHSTASSSASIGPRVTDGSNPSPSSGESTNFRFLFTPRAPRLIRGIAEGPINRPTASLYVAGPFRMGYVDFFRFLIPLYGLSLGLDVSNPRRGVTLYHEPVLAMLVQGSAGASASPACSSSMEMPSGVRIKAMRPSRGGRLIVTPRAIKALQVS